MDGNIFVEEEEEEEEEEEKRKRESEKVRHMKREEEKRRGERCGTVRPAVEAVEEEENEIG